MRTAPRRLRFALFCLCLALGAFAEAGVVTDGSVGAGGAIGKVGSDFPIPHTLGTKNGGNLFHSFSQFDLLSGESATFTGPNDVSNILARVTGGTASSIDGTLRSTIPGANLFFINPKGVLFGPNAKLEIDGSFTATTANFVKLQGGGRFDATTPANDVLTSAPIASFGFLGPQPAAITATGSVLDGASGKKMTFVGGNISLDQARLNAPSGRVELWSANSAGEIDAATGAGSLGGALDLNRARVDVSGSPSGSVAIRGGKLTVNRSTIASGNQGATPGGSVDVRVTGPASLILASRVTTTASGAGAAGDVVFQAGSLDLSIASTIASQASSGATAASRAGNVSVTTAGHINISDESSISASTFGPAPGGTVDVQSESMTIAGNQFIVLATGIFSNSNSTGDGGRGGNVRVRTGDLQIYAGGSIATDTKGHAKGGDLEINARNVTIAARGVDAKTGIFADTLAADGGSGGSVRLTADTVRITDGGLISTKTLGTGAGGDTELNVRELFISRGSSTFFTGIAADTPLPGPQGPGGDVRVKADIVRVVDGGQISANTFGLGEGGSVSVRAREVSVIGGSKLFSTISADSVSSTEGGPGGDVEVIADQLRILNGGRISAATFGSGAGGDVIVRAQEATIYSNNDNEFTGVAAASVSPTEAGKGGNLRIDVPKLTISGFGSIAADTEGPGAGGDVIVTTQTGRLLGGGRITASTDGLGKGGSVLVVGNDLSLSGSVGDRTSGIFSESTSTDEGGAGGIVQVRATTLRLTDGSSIAATSSSTGAGGSVAIQAQKLTLDTGATVAASATGPGVAGSVTITVQQPLEMHGGSAVQTTSAVSSSGTVSITSATDIILEDSSITVRASVGNAGSISLIMPGRLSMTNSSVLAEAGLNGGNVFIDPEFILLDHSRISANAILGAGGNITIIAGSFLASSSAVTASSEASVQGTVSIQSLIVDLSGALVPLSSSVLDASTRLREQCARRLGMDFSSFLVVGRGGTESAPDEPLPANGAGR